jgi:hypothetical protein
MTGKLVIEAVVVGLGLMAVGSAVSAVLIAAKGGDEYPKKADWAWMNVALFISGALFHLLCEGVGVNAWYCCNSNACAGTKCSSSPA